MDKQIKKLEELKGKQISNLFIYCDELYLKFSDNTFAVLIPKNITEGFGSAKTEVNIEEYDIDKSNKILVENGIISEEEYLEALKKEEELEKELEEKYKREHQERIEKYELEQLRILKQKYE